MQAKQGPLQGFVQTDVSFPCVRIKVGDRHHLCIEVVCQEFGAKLLCMPLF
jgi:hypothetical protein